MNKWINNKQKLIKNEWNCDKLNFKKKNIYKPTHKIEIKIR